jgi:hypothetical protein
MTSDWECKVRDTDGNMMMHIQKGAVLEHVGDRIILSFKGFAGTPGAVGTCEIFHRGVSIVKTRPDMSYRYLSASSELSLNIVLDGYRIPGVCSPTKNCDCGSLRTYGLGGPHTDWCSTRC